MGMPYVVLMPVFAKEILHGGPHTFGFLMGGSGLGALSGALYLASRRSVLGLESLLPRYATLFGLGLIAFALSRNIYLSFVLMVLTGAGMMLQMAASNTIIQTLVDNDKRGRVMSIFTMAFMGTVPFGSYMAGSLATWWGAPNTILLGGICCLLGAAWFACLLPKLRRQIRAIILAPQSDHIEQ
jgi:MFS family permease